MNYWLCHHLCGVFQAFLWHHKSHMLYDLYGIFSFYTCLLGWVLTFFSFYSLSLWIRLGHLSYSYAFMLFICYIIPYKLPTYWSLSSAIVSFSYILLVISRVACRMWTDQKRVSYAKATQNARSMTLPRSQALGKKRWEGKSVPATPWMGSRRCSN